MWMSDALSEIDLDLLITNISAIRDFHPMATNMIALSHINLLTINTVIASVALSHLDSTKGP